jgi:hypothetical protein
MLTDPFEDDALEVVRLRLSELALRDSRWTFNRSGLLRSVCSRNFCKPAGPQVLWLPIHFKSASPAASKAQLFFDVCAMKPANCWVTFVPLHVGHLGLAFSRSEMVMMSSKGFLHVSHMNS